MATSVFTAKLACPHCQAGKKLYPAGTHCLGNGKWEMCKYVQKLVRHNDPNWKFVKAFNQEKPALRLIRSIGNAAYDIDFELPVYVVFRRKE